jgi:hypothetical protein
MREKARGFLVLEQRELLLCLYCLSIRVVRRDEFASILDIRMPGLISKQNTTLGLFSRLLPKWSVIARGDSDWQALS